MIIIQYHNVQWNIKPVTIYNIISNFLYYIHMLFLATINSIPLLLLPKESHEMDLLTNLLWITKFCGLYNQLTCVSCELVSLESLEL